MVKYISFLIDIKINCFSFRKNTFNLIKAQFFLSTMVVKSVNYTQKHRPNINREIGY